jgi:flagellar biosynthesis/type III secretory pathway ATPase
VLHSISRLASRIASQEQRESAQRIREALAILDRSEDLINLGAYVSGSNARLDSALRLRADIDQFLRQEAGSEIQLDDTLAKLKMLAGGMPA